MREKGERERETEECVRISSIIIIIIARERELFIK